jgi:hypothetical protein
MNWTGYNSIHSKTNGTPDTLNAGVVSSSAARLGPDTTRRFIRTADLRFRVTDAVQSSFKIEDIVARFDGFVERTHLSSEINQRYTTAVSTDSTLETERFTVTNRLTIRVPVQRLDTMLKSLVGLIDFLDHRTVAAQDVRLLMLANELSQKRIKEHQTRVSDAIDEQGRKLKETLPAEQQLLVKQELADQSRLSNLGLEDRIAFSTISIDLYQRPDLRRTMLANEKNIKAFEPGLGTRILEALNEGWQILVILVLFLIRSWSILLMAAILYLIVIRYRSRTK